MVRNLVGPPVQGSDFFDRTREQEEILDYLHRDHLLLLAPRRVGKTSLMRRLEEVASDKGLEAAYFSVADTPDEPRFVEQLLAAVVGLDAGKQVFQTLRKSAAGKFLKRVKRVDVAGFGFELDPAEVDWSSLGDALTRALDRQQGRWLLLVDEIPMFVLRLLREDPSAARARKFLEWFRALRQRSDQEGRVRWLLAGSIGLDAVTARLNLGDTINDLRIYHLGPFTRESSDGLLRELAETHDLSLSEAVRSHLIDRVGWLIPYHLQLLFSEVRALSRGGDVERTVKTVDEAYETLLSPSHKAYFDYWRQRLHEELGKPDAGFALALLTAAARDEKGATRTTLKQVLRSHVNDQIERDEKLRFLLDVLEGDGYLVEEGERFTFRSPLVREFWLRRVIP